MSRSFTHLRRGLLGAAFAGSLGFGATQALASPDTTSRLPYCRPNNSYYQQVCMDACARHGYNYGYCGDLNTCECENL